MVSPAPYSTGNINYATRICQVSFLIARAIQSFQFSVVFTNDRYSQSRNLTYARPRQRGTASGRNARASGLRTRPDRCGDAHYRRYNRGGFGTYPYHGEQAGVPGDGRAASGLRTRPSDTLTT
jgi:hypothetical protein